MDEPPDCHHTIPLPPGWQTRTLTTRLRLALHRTDEAVGVRHVRVTPDERRSATNCGRVPIATVFRRAERGDGPLPHEPLRVVAMRYSGSRLPACGSAPP